MAGGGIKINNIKINGGADGATFIPSVSSNGVLSWTNDKGYTNPTPVNIKGADGQDGVDGATGAKLVSQVLQGQDANGGNIYLQTFDDGTTAIFTAPKGDKGDKGDKGEIIEPLITFNHKDFTWKYQYTINNEGTEVYTEYFAISSKKSALAVNRKIYHAEQYINTEGVSNNVQFFIHEYDGNTWLKRTNLSKGGEIEFDSATTDFRICWGLQLSLGIPLTYEILENNFNFQSPVNYSILNERIDETENNVKILSEKVESISSIEAISDNLFDPNNTVSGLLTNQGIISTNANYIVTDFIPVDVGNSYLVKETNTFQTDSGTVLRVCGYDSSKNFISVVYEESRKSIDSYKHPFEIPSGIAYIRVGFRITDTNISILRTRHAANKSIELFYSDSTSYTQGMCVSDTHAFISVSASKNVNPNDYVIRKVLLSDGSTVATGTDTFNHANGMTYNPKTNKVIVCALDGNTPIDSTTSDDDYSLFIANADTLTRESTVSLKETILAINSDCIGISGVAYNKHTDEYYVLTRAPIRFIVVLDSDFKLKRYFFMHKAINEGTRGDICCDSTLIYSPAWRNDLTIISNPSLINEVEIYTISTGKYIGTYTMNGLTHIESMDVNNGIFYSNFIDFVSGNGTKTYKTSGIFNIS